MTQFFVAYFRVSTARQGQSGLGLEAQRQAVNTFAARHEGEVLTEFVEVESGKRNDRPQLAAALAECKRKRATLLIAKLDRLARNVAFVAQLMETGIPFLAVDMPTADRFMLHVYAAMAEEEARRIGARTKAALAAAKARGTVLGTHGRELARRNVETAQAFAMTIEPAIRSLQAEGFATVRALTEEMNRRAIPTPGGGKWHLGTVHRVLTRLAA
ncbi:MAG: recombinase family protein [Rhodospirillales bacterium]|nr:recombinase family protein [Rhodospirillales bacterium]